MLPSLQRLPLHGVVATSTMPAGYYHASAADVARGWSNLQYYDPDAPDFVQVAWGAIDQSLKTSPFNPPVAEALRLVRYDHPNYFELARMTVQLDAGSISEVDPRMTGFMSIAKGAIDAMPEVIDMGYIKPSRLPYRPDYAELVAYAEKAKAEKAGARDDDDGPVYRTWEREAARALDAQREREATEEMKKFTRGDFNSHHTPRPSSRPSSPVRSAIRKKHANRRLGPL